MKKQSLQLILAVILYSTLFYSPSFADVHRESVTTMKFRGALGTIMKLMGASKPVQTAEYYQGDLHRTDTIDNKGRVATSQIVDLNRELFITIDHDKKRYSQMTFDQWREMVKSKLDEMKETQSSSEQKEGERSEEVDVKFDVDISKPGDSEQIAGTSAEKVIMTIKMEAEASDENKEGQEQEQTQRQQGELVITSTQWLAKTVSGQEEIDTFNKKLTEKIGILPGEGESEEVFSQLAQSQPQLAAAMKKVAQESKNFEGTVLKSHTVYETRGQANTSQNEQEQESTEIPTSVGRLLKGFGKKAQPKKEESDSTVLLETDTEYTICETKPLSSEIFSVPEKYKER